MTNGDNTGSGGSGGTPVPEPIEAPKEKRRIAVSDKVFAPDDIRRVCRVLQASIQERNPEAGIRVEVTGIEGDSYSGSVASLIEPDDYLVDRRIESVTASAYLERSNVHLSLEAGDGIFTSISNYVSVEGDDSTWVNGTVRRIELELSRVRDQFRLPWPLRGAMAVVVGVAIFATTYKLSGYLYAGEPERELFADRPDSDLYWPVSGAMLRLVGLAAAVVAGPAFVSWFTSLWPTIEIATGPEHLDATARRRRVIGAFVGIIALPIAINIVSAMIA